MTWYREADEDHKKRTEKLYINTKKLINEIKATIKKWEKARLKNATLHSKTRKGK